MCNNFKLRSRIKICKVWRQFVIPTSKRITGINVFRPSERAWFLVWRARPSSNRDPSNETRNQGPSISFSFRDFSCHRYFIEPSGQIFGSKSVEERLPKQYCVRSLEIGLDMNFSFSFSFFLSFFFFFFFWFPATFEGASCSNRFDIIFSRCFRERDSETEILRNTYLKQSVSIEGNHEFRSFTWSVDNCIEISEIRI